MSSPRPNPNTKINNIRENINAEEYAEELKMNIRCDEDDNHVAVLYCPNCLANFCVICSESTHSRKALSKHEIVRLTQRPEPPIYCHLHPQKTAEIICKEPTCIWINNPICTICHLQKTHKNHKYELIGYEYNKIRTNITNCLEEIETKRTTCDKNVEEYNKCISTYSSNNSGFWKTERDKIDKFYSDARTLALQTFDDFANNRIGILELFQNQYKNYKTNVRKIMHEVVIIFFFMIIKAGKDIDKPTSLIPSKSYNITYPDFELMNIKIEIPKDVQFQNQLGTRDVLFWNYSSNYIRNIITTKDVLSIEDRNNDKLYTYKDGRSILDLYDTGRYRSGCIVLVSCWSNSNLDEFRENELNNLMENNRWSRIVYVIDDLFLKNHKNDVDRMQEIARSDHRIEVMNSNNKQKIFDYIFEC